jgi:two-component system sensor histidine kinase YesM
MIFKTRELLELTKQEEQQLREAERKALQAQINPHFLYNTLYTIKALATLHGEKQILDITTSLGKLLRNAISSSTDVLPLSQSIELVEHYLRIVKIRFPDKLRCRISIQPSCEDVMTPKLIIQPFIENAVTHGLEPKLGDWYIRVDVFISGNRLIICVRDNGVGFDPDRNVQQQDTDHVGIRNVRQRLELFYRDQAEVRVTSKKHVGTIVRITLPME